MLYKFPAAKPIALTQTNQTNDSDWRASPKIPQFHQNSSKTKKWSVEIQEWPRANPHTKNSPKVWGSSRLQTVLRLYQLLHDFVNQQWHFLIVH